MNYKYILEELKKVKNESSKVYNKYLDLILRESNNIDYNKLKMLEKILDVYDKKEVKLRQEIKHSYTQECKEKSNELIKEYGCNNKYKAIYRNGKIQYFLHRKDIDFKNINIVYKIQNPTNTFAEEYPAVVIDDKTKILIYYNDSRVNSVKEYIEYKDGKIKNRRVYRKNFRYEKLIGDTIIMEFELNTEKSIVYYRFSNEDKTTVKYIIGSKNFIIDEPINQIDMKKITTRINQLKKDKHVGIEDMLKEFDIDDYFI